MKQQQQQRETPDVDICSMMEKKVFCWTKKRLTKDFKAI
jgi:hypothetical protein